MNELIWKQWIEKFESMTHEEIEEEIVNIQNDDSIPFVEKKLRLGFLYFQNDYIATAKQIFQEIKLKISEEAENTVFWDENNLGIKIYFETCLVTVEEPCACEEGNESCCLCCGSIICLAILSACFGTENVLNLLCVEDSYGHVDFGLCPNCICHCCCSWWCVLFEDV